ncbi:MAG: membrane protein insertion efficiency factor YidD [Solirubrobacterales bacterium]
MKRWPTRLLLALVAAYQRWISPTFPRRCKYEPTCSVYAASAIRELGALRGSIVAAWRVLRCNPLSDGGIDDLSGRRLFRDHPRREPGRAAAGTDPGTAPGGAEVAR